MDTVKALDQYIKHAGPFDGIIGFSVGASLAIFWLLWRQKQGDMPVKLGIFFSNFCGLNHLKAIGLEPELHLSAENLNLPTAHIWGSRDDCDGLANAEYCWGICVPDRRSMYVHGEGHEISTSAEDTIGMIKAIDRAIIRATDGRNNVLEPLGQNLH